jgi:hypothetical protein
MGAEEYAVLPDEGVDQIQEKLGSVSGPVAEMAESKGNGLNDPGAIP